jgi:hypothetical protein
MQFGYYLTNEEKLGNYIATWLVELIVKIVPIKIISKIAQKS